MDGTNRLLSAVPLHILSNNLYGLCDIFHVLQYTVCDPPPNDMVYILLGAGNQTQMGSQSLHIHIPDPLPKPHGLDIFWCAVHPITYTIILQLHR